jgi:hypothetical protein
MKREETRPRAIVSMRAHPLLVHEFGGGAYESDESPGVRGERTQAERRPRRGRESLRCE